MKEKKNKPSKQMIAAAQKAVHTQAFAIAIKSGVEEIMNDLFEQKKYPWNDSVKDNDLFIEMHGKYCKDIKDMCFVSDENKLDFDKTLVENVEKKGFAVSKFGSIVKMIGEAESDEKKAAIELLTTMEAISKIPSGIINALSGKTLERLRDFTLSLVSDKLVPSEELLAISSHKYRNDVPGNVDELINEVLSKN